MTTRIKLRRDTAANWTANNPILAAGEPGLETDTGKTKYGDGTTAWTSLGYATGGITAREQIGYFMTYGDVPNTTNGDDWWFESVKTDPNGNAYYVGGADISQWARVVKVNSLGELQWDKEISWADGYEGNAVSAVYNTATDQLVVAAQMWKMDTPELGAAVITINAETGAMIGNPTMIRDEIQDDGSATGTIDPSDIILDSNGDPIVVGHKNGNASIYALTTTSVGATDAIFVDAAIFTDKTPFPYNDWYITGTNILGESLVVDVNYYYNQSATALPPTGTGATFVLSDDGVGGYTVVSVATTGTNYNVGNKILVLGTELGGSDGTHDATITVSGVDSGGVTAATVTGSALATAPVGGWTVTGTNIVSGSNAFITVQWKVNAAGQAYFPDYPERFGAAMAQAGSGFALGDTLYLNPEQYGGSTSATIAVTNIDGSGQILNFTFTGTFNTSTIKLVTSNSIDFATEGNWTAVNYSAEAFVWTPSWAKTFGDSEFDKANAVARDSAGNIYLACKSYDDTRLSQNGYGTNIAVLVKLDSTGNLLWSKSFTPSGYVGNFTDGYTGVAVDSNSDVIVAESNVITKVDSTGTVIWQKIIADGEAMGMWNTCVAVDSNNNVYVNGEYDYMGQTTSDDFLVSKFDSNGNVLWQREIGTSTEENSSWNNGFQILSVVNDQVYIAGSSVQGTDDSAIAVSFPADGSGADINHRGRFFMHTATWTVSTSTATVYDVTFAITATQVTLTTETNFTCVTTSTDISSLALRTGDVDGRIEDLYFISFEDGSVQTTAYTGRLDRLENFIQNTNNFYPNITHANKLLRWDADGYSNSVQIYIPHNSDVPFPIGTQLHFVKERGINAFMFWCWGVVGNVNEMRIIPSSPANGFEGNVFNTDEGWSVRHLNGTHIPARATLTKTDTNTWLLECSSTSHVMDWSW